jgi:ABC-type molybdate transport system substrate-binding protein
MKQGMRYFGCILVGWLLLIAGCANPNRLVVYADPWLTEYAGGMVDQFQAAHPETDIQLKFLSSEVVVQHIRFGQPVDVFLCFGCEWFHQDDFRVRIAEESTLAASQVVELVRADSGFTAKQSAMGTKDAIMMEASDRPMRSYAEQAGFGFGQQKKPVLIANFQRQAMDYMLRGWVSEGYLPIHFARRHGKQFRTKRTGPAIPNAFTAILLDNAPHPGLAQEFFDLLKSEKSRQLLAQMSFLP